MKAIILAAGYATRLYPLTKNYPKPLLPVGGKPILDWLIEDLTPIIDEFVVVTNHKFFPFFSIWAKENVRIIDDGTENNDARLGAVKDIQLAAEEIVDDVFVMAGDNLLTFSLVPFISFAKETGTSCVMCYEEDKLESLRKTAVITVDAQNMITSYEEKPKEPLGTLAVPPFYYYRFQDIARIPEALKEGCACDAPGSFAAWLAQKVRMHAWLMPGSRYDIGDLQSYTAVKDSYRGLCK